ncbi:diguanylate cyclase domain-containing protein [Pararhodospirillum oryzae]|uniref:Diguanylate cyclase n=1 Tax=Pararhodospirillum oryzae TaxID=478448 RepID=A0A512H704_9PROT|nr:diguanylate cyclase [Pararhodospirillum oryzae]GEO81233.1 hypothetical protein ROR02_13640 [Pararhodospirillum oryzae]
MTLTRPHARVGPSSSDGSLSPPPPEGQHREPEIPAWGYRWIIGVVYCVVGLVALGVFVSERARLDDTLTAVATDRARTVFQILDVTREWNAVHGGVYVAPAPVPETAAPTDPPPAVLPDGRRLEALNPARMTRELAALAARREGIVFHMTSLAPLGPENAPDPWERESLERFASGAARERLALIPADRAKGQRAVHRYMAPLTARESCVGCHAGSGVQVGEHLGGISITLPADALVASRDEQLAHAAFICLVGALVVGVLAHVTLAQGRRVMMAWQERRTMGDLQRAHRFQEAVIEARTRQLSNVNGALLDEISKVQAARRALEESEARTRAVVESSQDGFLMVQGWRVLFANRRLSEITGYSHREIMAMSALTLFAPEDRDRIQEINARRLKGEVVPTHYRASVLRRDGVTRRVVEMDVVVHPGSGRDVPQVVISVKDVTDALAAERSLRIAQAVFDHTAEGIMVLDAQDRIVRVNSAFSVITGYAPEEVIGRSPELLRSGHHPPAFFEQMHAALRARGRWEGEVWNRRKDGEMYVEWLHLTALPEGEGEPGGLVASFSDITRRKAAEDVILHQATYDALTDLPNRRLFDDRLDVTLATALRHDRRFALMYVDLDHFKAVNDTLGHAAGDMLLAEAARRMVGCVRSADTVARLGGDEFAIILNDLDRGNRVEEVAQRVRRALEHPFALTEGPALVSASIGAAVHPQDGLTAADLRRAADRALYAAKAAGRNTACYASPIQPEV